MCTPLTSSTNHPPLQSPFSPISCCAHVTTRSRQRHSQVHTPDDVRAVLERRGVCGRGRGRGQTVQVASQATTVAADCMWSSIFHAARVYIDGLQRPSSPSESDVLASAMWAKRYPCWSICSRWRFRRGISTSTTVSVTQSSDMLDTDCAPQSVRDGLAGAL